MEKQAPVIRMIRESQHDLSLPNLTLEEVKAFYVCLDKYLRDTETTHWFETNENGRKCLCLPHLTSLAPSVMAMKIAKVSAFITGYLMALGVDENGNRS